MLHLLEEIPAQGTQNDEPTMCMPSEFGVQLTRHQIEIEKAKLLRKLCRSESTRMVYEKLLKSSPDDWSCWKGHLESSIFENKIELTENLAKHIIQEQEGSRIQLRGPHLMSVEIGMEQVRRNASDEAVRELGSSIQKYAEIFAHRAACAFGDLEHYVNMLLRTNEEATKDVIVSLLEFAETLRQKSATSSQAESSSGDGISNKERHSKLLAYIFAVKLTHKVISSRREFADRFLPDWVELVSEWRATLSLSSSNEGEEVSGFKILRTQACDTTSVLICTRSLAFIDAERIETR
jgi:hypothetical protein